MGSGYFQTYNNVFYRSADGNGTNNFDPWAVEKHISTMFFMMERSGDLYLAVERVSLITIMHIMEQMHQIMIPIRLFLRKTSLREVLRHGSKRNG